MRKLVKQNVHPPSSNFTSNPLKRTRTHHLHFVKDEMEHEGLDSYTISIDSQEINDTDEFDEEDIDIDSILGVI